MLIRQTTVSTVAGLAFLVIALLLGGGVWFTTQTIAQERSAVARQAQFKQLGYDLANASDFLTNECRKYVVSTDPQHLQEYWNEINVTKTRDNVLTHLKSLGATSDEFALVDEAKHNSDALVGTETRAQRLTLEASGTPEAAMPPAIASFKLDQADEALRPADKMAAARRIMFDAQYEHDKSIIMGPIKEFQDKMNTRAAHESEAAKSKTRAALTLLIVLAFLIPAGIGAVLWIYQTQLGVPVANYITALQGHQEGDQDFALVPHGTEELRSLAGTFNEQFQANQRQISRNQALIGNLQTLVSQITEDAQSLMRASAGLASSITEIGTATHDISTTMREVACASEQSARGAGEVAQGNAAQAQALSQGTDLVKRLSETVQGVAHDAAMATQAAAQADQVAGAGADVVRQSVDRMARIRNTVTESSEVVRILGEASAQIGGIVQTIDEIAGQTNLLALNAAIEAARAGDAGRGFAVVADEVRKLAERSGVATKQIGQLIEQVQAQTQEAVTAMAVGMREVESGTDLAEQAGRALIEIQDVVRSVTERVAGIGTAAAEMTSASNEVTRAITDVAAVVEESSAAAEEMSACAEEVSASVQTVAGTTVQQSNAVQGMVASAEELAAIAQRLQNAVVQFGSGESLLSGSPQQAPGDRRALRRAA